MPNVAMLLRAFTRPWPAPLSRACWTHAAMSPLWHPSPPLRDSRSHVGAAEEVEGRGGLDVHLRKMKDESLARKMKDESLALCCMHIEAASMCT
jgi:hypothetical protein